MGPNFGSDGTERDCEVSRGGKREVRGARLDVVKDGPGNAPEGSTDEREEIRPERGRTT